MSNEVDNHNSYTHEKVARIRNEVLAAIAKNAKEPINMAGVGGLLMELELKLGKTAYLIQKGKAELPELSVEQRRQLQINVLQNAF